MATTGFPPAIVSLLTHPLFFRLPNMASQNIFANILTQESLPLMYLFDKDSTI